MQLAYRNLGSPRVAGAVSRRGFKAPYNAFAVRGDQSQLMGSTVDIAAGVL